MKAVRLAIPDVVLLKPKVFRDVRGHFFESYNRDAFRKMTGVGADFVQDNHSRSERGVLRGLHYQLPPRAQGKLVRVVRGEVFDVAVDIRRGSPTFGRWVGHVLSDRNRAQLWIPEGFAHGFLTLSAAADLVYKVTAPHDPERERCIQWDDPEIGVRWRRDQDIILSGRDLLGGRLSESEVFRWDGGAGAP